MIVTHKLTMDLTRRDKIPCIDVMQDDKYSRDLEIRLKTNGVPYQLPEDCSVLIRFRKADRRYGLYDTMPDGTKAWSIAEGVLTVRLAPQVCTAAGKAELMLTVLQGQKELSFFTIHLNVHKRMDGAISSEPYINIERFVPQPASAVPGQFLRVLSTDESGRITATETAEAASADAAAGAAAFYVTLTASDSGYSADMTTAQMEAAYQDGQSVYCLFPFDEFYLCMQLVSRIYEGMAWIFSVMLEGTSIMVMIMDGQVEVMSTEFMTADSMPSIPSVLPNPYKLKFTGAISAAYDGSMPITVTIPVELPAVTADNNGAFLRVVEGVWAASTLESAEEVSF